MIPPMSFLLVKKWVESQIVIKPCNVYILGNLIWRTEDFNGVIMYFNRSKGVGGCNWSHIHIYEILFHDYKYILNLSWCASIPQPIYRLQFDGGGWNKKEKTNRSDFKTGRLPRPIQSKVGIPFIDSNVHTKENRHENRGIFFWQDSFRVGFKNSGQIILVANIIKF